MVCLAPLGNVVFLLIQVYNVVTGIKLPLDFTEPHVPAYRVFYQRGVSGHIRF